MRHIKTVVLVCAVIAGFIAVYICASKVSALFASREPAVATLSVKIGDFREILKLSVLDVDIEDAYPVDVNGKKVIYKIPAHCEFKYNLKKVVMEKTDTTIVIKLPKCDTEVTSQAAPTILYEEEGMLSALLGNNVNDAQDRAMLVELTEKIKRRVSKEYQDIAFSQAKTLLGSFYANSGKKVIVLKR